MFYTDERTARNTTNNIAAVFNIVIRYPGTTHMGSNRSSRMLNKKSLLLLLLSLAEVIEERVDPSAKVGPHCHSISLMQCSQSSRRSVHRTAREHVLKM